MNRLLPIFIFSILFILVFSNQSFANPVSPEDTDTGVRGKVVDKTTKSALEYATIMVYKLPDSVFVIGGITGKDGQFDLKLKPGKYYLSIQFLGYGTVQSGNIQVEKGIKTTELGSFFIEPDQQLLDQVEVVAEKSTMEMTLDKKVYNIGKDISSTSGNATEVLENIPSVTVDIDGNVSLRGDDGVRILIDGKVSGMAGINSRDALRSLQADMIERIEVVTNPSVRYDAEGTSGIINIVLKKDSKQGFNGSVDATIGYPQQYGFGINTNYRFKKFNFFANYAYNYRERKGSGELYKEIYNEGTYVTNQNSTRNRSSSGNTIRFGTEYYFNASSSISGSLMYRLSHDKNISTITYYDYAPNNDLLNHSERIENELEDDPNLEYALNYKKQFKRKDQSLTASLQYFNNNETENGTITENYFAPNPNDLVSGYQKSINDQFESNLQAQADYYHPFQGKARLEGGFKLQVRQIDNNYEVSEKDSTGNFVNLAQFTNHFNYDESIYAAYLLYGDDRGRFSYQFGLRGEYSEIQTNLQETNEKSDKSFFDMFPSAHFTFKITEADHIQISYSRRIRRPEFMQLNPFHSYSDNRNIWTGNPELKPVYTDAYELGYIRYWEKANLNFNTYYRKSKDVFQRIETIDSSGITYIRPENFARSDAYGAELIGSFTGIKKLNLNGNLNFFRTITDGDLGDKSYHTDSYSWTGRINSKYTIAKGTDLQLTANYQASIATAQGNRLPMWFLDFGASKDIIKGKGTLTLNVRDIFGSRRHAFETNGDNFYSRTDQRWGSTVVSLNFNYRINQTKKKNPDRQQGGGEEGGMEF
jgi:outer membrane receptor protein involved in Fe transport